MAQERARPKITNQTGAALTSLKRPKEERNKQVI